MEPSGPPPTTSTQASSSGGARLHAQAPHRSSAVRLARSVRQALAPLAPFVLLAALLALSLAFHLYSAEHPTSWYQSADERSYGKLAVDLAEHGHYGDRTTGMSDPLHWAPGAPVLFAFAHKLFPDRASAETDDIPSAYRLQAVVSTLTAGAASWLVWMLAGPWAGLVAAALVGFYPPLILATGEQLSEPLGAFLLIAAFAVLAVATRFRKLWATVGAGVLLGLAVLTRADLLPVPFLVAALVGAWAWWTGEGLRRGVLAAAVLATAAAITVAPWVAYASMRAGRFVPVTTAGPSSLFIGTYLPGNGTTAGLKRTLGDEAKRLNPRFHGIPNSELQAQWVLDVIAARHPGLEPHAALTLEARRNLVRYGLGQPLRFGAMMLDKGLHRLWSHYARGGARQELIAIRAWHVVLVLLCLSGLVLGVVRHRSLLLATILTAAVTLTAVHMLAVSQARYNLPLMPTLIAGGVTGWFLAARPAPGEGRASQRQAGTATYRNS
jgi:4-amino-4-deoxy-L-arabinose transferase-like glycosyltransferase